MNTVSDIAKHNLCIIFFSAAKIFRIKSVPSLVEYL